MNLTGKTIAITASRKAEEQGEAFTRNGASVFFAPTVRIAPVGEDALLKEATAAVLKTDPDYLLVTTGFGLNGWLDAADSAGTGEQLREKFGKAAILVRGAKGRGAVRGHGWSDSGIANAETTESLVDLALTHELSGKTVVLQQHGNPDPAQVKRLEDAGATVIEGRPHRWEQPLEPALVEELIQKTIAGEIDAITFTAAPAVEALFARARERGSYEELVSALKNTVIGSVGPVTTVPLAEAGLTPVEPERHRLGALTKLVTETLSK